jgi:type I restriction enzyme S subunit
VITASLAKISQKVDYGVTASADANPVGPKFLRITDIQGGMVDWPSVPYCQADERKLANSRLAVGDIVFARTGATTGKSFLIRHCPENAVFASYLIRVRPNKLVDPVFLSHYFDSAGYWEQIAQKAEGAAQPGVNASKLQELEVPLPPIEEQRRIAAILDQADALRAKRRAALAELDEMAQAIFVEMFGTPADLEFRWGLAPLGPLLDFLTSGSRGWAAHYAEEGALFLRIQNVRSDELDLSDVAFVQAPATAEARRTKVEPDDVLLSITADLGRTAVIPATIGIAFINQHLVILRTKRLQPRFLSAYLASPLGQEQVLKRNRQGVKAGLNFDDVRSVGVPVVPRPLQEEFASRLQQTDQLRQRAKSALDTLDALFATLQHRAFRGEL